MTVCSEEPLIYLDLGFPLVALVLRNLIKAEIESSRVAADTDAAANTTVRMVSVFT